MGHTVHREAAQAALGRLSCIPVRRASSGPRGSFLASDAAARHLDTTFAERGSKDSVIDVVGRWLDEEFRSHRDMIGLHAATLATNPSIRGSENPQHHRVPPLGHRRLCRRRPPPPHRPGHHPRRRALVGALAALLDVGATSNNLDEILHTAKQLVNLIVTSTDKNS
jgi:hypothetical protein